VRERESGGGREDRGEERREREREREEVENVQQPHAAPEDGRRSNEK